MLALSLVLLGLSLNDVILVLYPSLLFLQILTVIFRAVNACMAFAVQLGALMDDILRNTRAQAAQITQTRKDVQAAVQAMAGVPQETYFSCCTISFCHVQLSHCREFSTPKTDYLYLFFFLQMLLRRGGPSSSTPAWPPIPV